MNQQSKDPIAQIDRSQNRSDLLQSTQPQHNLLQLRVATKRLLAFLHRGGQYAHLWTDAGHRSYWFRVDGRGRGGRAQRPRRVPKSWLRHNIYFTVNPLSAIPPQNTSGSRDRRYISSQSDYICAVNALFAEYDGKDYVYALEYRALLPANFQALSRAEQQQARMAAKELLFYQSPERFKRRALHHVEALPFAPSIIIDSGGGYHCYWLLERTVPLDESNRDDVQMIQHGWVQMVGGDRGAADLRRVLRLPGSYNRKSGFGENSPRVQFVKADFRSRYMYQDLEQAVNEWLYEEERRRRNRVAHFQRRQQYEQRMRSGMERLVEVQRNLPTGQWQEEAEATLDAADRERRQQIREQYNAEHRIVDLLLAHGYHLYHSGNDQIRLARPGRDRRHTSVTIFPAQANGRPEISVHFSTNDPLHSREYIDTATGKVRRQVNDAFAVYTKLEHNGDWAAAYAHVGQRE